MPGFKIGHSIQTETKGIWAWLVDHPTQPDRALLLLDTEGIGAVQGCATQQQVRFITIFRGI